MIKECDVIITETAQHDLESIWEYISKDSMGNASNFLDQLEKMMYSLEYFPERGNIIPESRYLHTTRYRHLIYKKYRIVYKIDVKNVCILRIFHGSKLLDMASLESEIE